MKSVYLLLASVCAFAMTSCVKDNSVKPSNEDGKFIDLQASESFDWATTGDVLCNIESTGVSRISVSETPDGEPFATFFAGGKLSANPVSLNIPSTVTTLYVSYATESGAMSAPQAVNVANNTMSFTVGGSGRPFDDSDMEKTGNIIYIPSRANGWATMMFEDQWPSYGDYDFNDMVFNYKVQLHLTGANKVEAMQIGVRMKAVSGSFPYDIYLLMHGLTNEKIGDIERVVSRNTLPTANVAMTLLDPVDPTKERALFHMEGLRGNINKQPGAIWVNTEPGYELADDQLVEVAYVVYFKNPVDLESVNFAGLDFFLARNDGGQLGMEIHRCNYEPINEDLYYSLVDPNIRDFYKSVDNLIWAVNIPASVDHAYEKGDFLKAYPEFRNWVQSSGTLSKDWYMHGNKEYLVSKR